MISELNTSTKMTKIIFSTRLCNTLGRAETKRSLIRLKDYIRPILDRSNKKENKMKTQIEAKETTKRRKEKKQATATTTKLRCMKQHLETK